MESRVREISDILWARHPASIATFTATSAAGVQALRVTATRNAGLCRHGWGIPFGCIGTGRLVALLLSATCAAASGVAASAYSAADPRWYLDVQTYSFHEHTSEVDLHNTTPGIGVLRRQRGWLLGAGVFRNSLGRGAAYGYVGYQRPVGPVLLGGIVGLTHHYNANHGGGVPLAAGVVTLPLTERWGIDLVAIPRVANYTYATLNVSVSWRFR